MKIEQQIVSLELAKKLREAGYPQDKSIWIYFSFFQEASDNNMPLETRKRICVETTAKYYAAPTVAELGEIFFQNKWFDIDGKIVTLEIGFRECSLYTVDNRPFIEFIEKSEADARAKMWLYLKENNLLIGEPKDRKSSDKGQ